MSQAITEVHATLLYKVHEGLLLRYLFWLANYS